MSPADRHRFKDAQAAQTEFALVNPKCEMRALQAGNTVALPAATNRRQNVYIQAAPIYASGAAPLPQPYVPDANSWIAAHQAGHAMGAKRALTDASYLACMAEAGWIPRSTSPQN
jgi:hypothetical protein